MGKKSSPRFDHNTHNHNSTEHTQTKRRLNAEEASSRPSKAPKNRHEIPAQGPGQEVNPHQGRDGVTDYIPEEPQSVGRRDSGIVLTECPRKPSRRRAGELGKSTPEAARVRASEKITKKTPGRERIKGTQKTSAPPWESSWEQILDQPLINLSRCQDGSQTRKGFKRHQHLDSICSEGEAKLCGTYAKPQRSSTSQPHTSTTRATSTTQDAASASRWRTPGPSSSRRYATSPRPCWSEHASTTSRQQTCIRASHAQGNETAATTAATTTAAARQGQPPSSASSSVIKGARPRRPPPPRPRPERLHQRFGEQGAPQQARAARQAAAHNTSRSTSSTTSSPSTSTSSSTSSSPTEKCDTGSHQIQKALLTDQATTRHGQAAMPHRGSTSQHQHQQREHSLPPSDDIRTGSGKGKQRQRQGQGLDSTLLPPHRRHPERDDDDDDDDEPPRHLRQGQGIQQLPPSNDIRRYAGGKGSAH